MKLIPKVKPGFVSAHSPCWLRNSQRKLVRYQLRNHRLKTFQRWRVDSEVLAALVDSGKVNENWVGADWENINKTTSKGDAWFCECAQPHVDLETVNENWATIIFEIVKVIDSKGNA